MTSLLKYWAKVAATGVVVALVLDLAMVGHPEPQEMARNPYVSALVLVLIAVAAKTIAGDPPNGEDGVDGA